MSLDLFCEVLFCALLSFHPLLPLFASRERFVVKLYVGIDVLFATDLFAVERVLFRSSQKYSGLVVEVCSASLFDPRINLPQLRSLPSRDSMLKLLKFCW
jgi:hypothetical protein